MIEEQKHPHHYDLRKAPGQLRRFFSSIGPGVITGAADDDPSGIGTYSSAGAQFGTAMLWTACLTWPLMAAVQMMCARIGMVTGEGLAASLKKKIPRSVLLIMSIALFIANTMNIGADLSAMADAAKMLTGWSSTFFILLFAVGITFATVHLTYQKIARTLKWLAIFLFAYIATAFIIGPDWKSVLHDTIVPSIPKGSWAMLVALLGTTISPYLFFWQASQEVEEQKCLGLDTAEKRIGASKIELLLRRIDVGIGTFFSNLVMYFIILTTAITLHKPGAEAIETSVQAAAALKPLAGNLAAFLYTFGLIGTGLLAIPTLSGASAYAFAETFDWPQGLGDTWREAKAFYAVIAASMFFSLAITFSAINPIKALYWSAVVNGLLAPFLLIGILMVATDRKLMHDQPSSRGMTVVVTITTIIMFLAGVGMFVF